MEVVRIDEGLWRWTTPHPAWRPGEEWPREVGCVYHEAPGAVVLVDPLVPPDAAEAERFWRALDRDVERLGHEVVVLTTCPWHVRSADVVAGRYGGRRLGAGDLAGATLPEGVSGVPAPTADEVVWWLAQARAVVPGDALLGDEEGLRVCPASWLDGGGERSALVDELLPLLDLPVERVLVSHGAPVLHDGRAALARALGQRVA